MSNHHFSCRNNGLSGTPGLTLVDREKRNAVLDETKFGMSGLADDKTRTELGKLLSVNYLLSGMILDLQGMLVVVDSRIIFGVVPGKFLLRRWKKREEIPHYFCA